MLGTLLGGRRRRRRLELRHACSLGDEEDKEEEEGQARVQVQRGRDRGAEKGLSSAAEEEGPGARCAGAAVERGEEEREEARVLGGAGDCAAHEEEREEKESLPLLGGDAVGSGVGLGLRRAQEGQEGRRRLWAREARAWSAPYFMISSCYYYY